MLFMVVEHFRDNDVVPAHRRLRESGRPEERLAAGRGRLITSHFTCIHGLPGDARAYFREETEADVSFAL
jgi:hypothetical protein